MYFPAVTLWDSHFLHSFLILRALSVLARPRDILLSNFVWDMMVENSFPAGTIRDRWRSPSWDGVVTAPSFSPRSRLFWAVKVSEVGRKVSSPGALRNSRLKLEGTRSFKRPKEEEGCAFCCVCWCCWFEFSSGNRSRFVTSVQNFQAWCINDNIFAFQPPSLSCVGFSGASELKDYLFNLREKYESQKYWCTENKVEPPAHAVG